MKTVHKKIEKEYIQINSELSGLIVLGIKNPEQEKVYSSLYISAYTQVFNPIQDLCYSLKIM